MSFQVGARLVTNQFNLLHVKHLKTGQYAYSDKFISLDRRATNGVGVVVVKTPLTIELNELLQKEEETLEQISAECVAQDFANPIAKVLGSTMMNGKHCLIMESGWQSLEEILQSRHEEVDQEESIDLSTKIIRLADNLHSTGFIHANISSENVVYKFPTVFHEQWHIYALLEEAIPAATGARRADLENVLSQLPMLTPYHPFYYNEPLTNLTFFFTNGCSATPIGSDVAQRSRHPAPLDDVSSYSSPEALLRGFNSPKSDVYSSCLVAARVCIGAPLLRVIGGSKTDKIDSILRRMVSIKGPFKHGVLETYLDRGLYFTSNCTLARDPDLPRYNLKTTLRQTLLDGREWSDENFTKVYAFLASGLKHNADRRGSAESLLLLLQNVN